MMIIIFLTVAYVFGEKMPLTSEMLMDPFQRETLILSENYFF